jgi:hypothetical protein
LESLSPSSAIYKDMKTDHAHTVVEKKSPTWVWALQIGIAAVAIGLSITSIIYPVYAVAATFTVAAIILLLFGIEHVVTGVFVKGSRLVHIGLGGLIIILSSIVIAYPTATATLVVWLAAIALLFSGVARTSCRHICLNNGLTNMGGTTSRICDWNSLTGVRHKALCHRNIWTATAKCYPSHGSLNRYYGSLKYNTVAG